MSQPSRFRSIRPANAAVLAASFGLLAFAVLPARAAVGTATDSNSFSSSAASSSTAGISTSDAWGTDGAGDLTAGLTALPAAPEPAANPAAGGQVYHGYNRHASGWKAHLSFEGGGGADAPIGADSKVITWGPQVTLGAGWKFTSHLSALVEYQFIDDKLPAYLTRQAGSVGGNAHIWSFTVDPVYDLFPKRASDIYITGGGGFYRKLTSFTDPQPVTYCYYFCYGGYSNVTVSHFSSNQGGLNAGFGLTHRLGSPDMGGVSRLRVYVEARYLWIDTPGKGTAEGLGRTELVPITIGLRW